MKRRIAILSLILAIVSVPHIGSAADATVAGQGPATITYLIAGQTLICRATMVVTFAQRSSTFVETENWGPGTGQAQGCIVDPPSTTFVASNVAPKVQQCFPSGLGGIDTAPYAESVSGNTYTLSASSSSCGSPVVSDVIIFTVGANTITYSHKYSVGGHAQTTASGTIARVL